MPSLAVQINKKGQLFWINPQTTTFGTPYRNRWRMPKTLPTLGLVAFQNGYNVLVQNVTITPKQTLKYVDSMHFESFKIFWLWWTSYCVQSKLFLFIFLHVITLTIEKESIIMSLEKKSFSIMHFWHNWRERIATIHPIKWKQIKSASRYHNCCQIQHISSFYLKFNCHGLEVKDMWSFNLWK